MVYKASKGGVRSGNTLRSSSVSRAKRYSRQACILSRSNLPPTEVPTFLESATEDQLVVSTLGVTDVLLSLNKKGRWQLPAIVSHMITTGYFSEGKTAVSYLERHKLKRKANCVSFVCNREHLRNVVPKQTRYFCFNTDNLNNAQSNRQWRRKKADVLKNIKPKVNEIPKEKKNKNKRQIKTIEVFTVSGKNNLGLASSNPEYRVEVIQPCPQSCSLAYNPKYTNVHENSPPEDRKDTKANTSFSKSKRRHRKRFTANDFRMYRDEIEAADFWSEDYEESDLDLICETDSDDYEISEINLSLTESYTGEDYSDEPKHISEIFLDAFISHAEKARLLCDGQSLSRRRKDSSRCDLPKPSEIQDKSHIVYIDENPARFRQKQKPETRKQRKKGKRTNQSPATTTPTSKPTTYKALDYARVIMRSADMTPETLRAKYGHHYAEAECDPRRFLVNVTDDVHNLLCTHRYVEQNAMYTSYLVFVHDGVYDDGLDTFKVIFNSNICVETKAVSKQIPFKETSVEDIMHYIACLLLDMKEENLLSLNYPPSQETTMKPMLTFVNNLMKVNVETFRTFDEIIRVSQTGAMQESDSAMTSLSNLVKHLDTDIFCDICYENINPSQAGSIPGTRLLRCSHIFCDDCWRSHFKARLNNGALKMACPGYQCDETVGPVTLLSLLHVSEVTKLFQRKCEGEVESFTNSRWCPNPNCGRIVKLDNHVTDESFDVTCSCGMEFCTLCLSKPHWPARCAQAQEYKDKLSGIRLPEDSVSAEDIFQPSQSMAPRNTEVMEIVGRVCPKCTKFIDKNGGCMHMTCKCGHEFCWFCLKDWRGHLHCAPDPSVVHAHTRKMKVNHITIAHTAVEDTTGASQPKAAASRHKATMYQRALQQRIDARSSKYHQHIVKMAKKLAQMSEKDLQLKRQILSICGLDVSNIREDSLVQANTKLHVTRFLRSCIVIKRALHHVTEFTFVLLQNVSDSADRRRILKMADDLNGYCLFLKSILELGENQNLRVAIRRLVDIQAWAKRTLAVLIGSVNVFKC